MRSRLVLALGAVAQTASAEPRFEASGFVGLMSFSEQTGLGDGMSADQRPDTAPSLGTRLLVVLAPDLALERGYRLRAGIEGELAFAAAYTSTGSIDQPTYFAPVFGWRAHALVGLDGAPGGVRPHLLVGGGGATVVSESPFMRKESDGTVYGGAGVSLPVAEAWWLRIDARGGVMSAEPGIAWNYELQFGLAASFDLAVHRTTRYPDAPLPQPRIAVRDGDEDGLPDSLDACPDEPESVNGLADDDGCAEPDTDGDGLVGTADACPDVAEDRDGVADDDGCADPDDDEDGFSDVQDACPVVAEVRNGFDDEDGCPDGIPADVQAMLTEAVRGLAPGRAVTAKSKAQLAPVITLLQARPAIRMRITVRRADKRTDAAVTNAETIKRAFVELGIAAERLETAAGEQAVDAPAIQLELLATS